MAYQSIIANSSLKYKWPSWVVYDSSFRQEMAGSPGQSWARVDPSIYLLCFFGQNVTGENWCTLCQSLDHTNQTCPTRPRKRSWSAAMGTGGTQRQARATEVCLKFNKFAGDCNLGKNVATAMCVVHAAIHTQCPGARLLREEQAHQTIEVQTRDWCG